MKRIICVLGAVLAIGVWSTSQSYGAVKPVSPRQQPSASTWALKWQANFSTPAKLGSFSGCDNNDGLPTAYCSGLPTALQSQWWAYPYPWPDTATEENMPLGGYYDPSETVWISG